MGRPKLEQEKKLSKWFIFRLTEDELKRIHDAAETCGKSPGPLVRAKLFKGRFPNAKTPKLDLYTYAELKKIGINLNQLTKKVNSGLLPVGILSVLMKLMQLQETIIAKLLYDRNAENR
jgi:hypothetical protein